MSSSQDGGPRQPLLLTQAQRKLIAKIVPSLAERLKPRERWVALVSLTHPEMMDLQEKVAGELDGARKGTRRSMLQHLLDAVRLGLNQFQGARPIPASERVYQFKVTLLRTQPPIWRRFHTKDCTLDKLHEHIQTSMGWTNSHLNQFKIGEQTYADPLLMQESFDEWGCQDSTTTKLSRLLPKTGEPFRIEYEYDFGDGWWHEVLFEGCLRIWPGMRYPLCLEGARTCPPEDIGGTGSYAIFLEALADRKHEQHKMFKAWIDRKFDSEAFDANVATQLMSRGIFDWRRAR